MLDQNLVAEVDIFEGKNQGLIIIEVEFEAETQALAFTPPSWFGQEVSSDKRYKNKNLAG